MEQQEIIVKFNALQEEGRKIEEQIGMINQQIGEFQVLLLSLDKIEEKGEILAGLGKGVYVKSEIKEKELFVNIGNNIVLKKSNSETRKIVESQIVQLDEVKQHLLREIEKINLQLRFLVEMAEKSGGGETG